MSGSIEGPLEMVGLELRHVFVRHGRGPDVVHDVSVDCPRGQITALLGPNGAGKSSLLKGIIGLLPCRGDILLHGQDLTSMSALERARRVAYVPQRTRLDASLSVREVVDQGRFAHRGPFARPSRQDRLAVDQALSEVDGRNLEHRAFTQLSGGEQQKVLIARALATGAEVLLLDEPTASLDAWHVLIVHRLLRRLADRDWCILVVLHGLDEAHRHADRAILFVEGRVHVAGPVGAIVAPEPVRRIYDVDLRNNAGIGLFLPEESS